MEAFGEPHIKVHPVQTFFAYDEVTNISSCKIVNCPFNTVGRHSNNLTKHIKRNHAHMNANLEKDITEYHQERKQKKFKTNGKVSETVSVKINKIEFENALLELVNLNGRPYSMYGDSGMLRMIGPILSAFDDNQTPISTSRESLQKQSEVKCLNLTKFISEEMKGKRFSLSIDIGTANDGRSILAVNAQYKVNGKMVFRCLGMRVNRQSSSAVRLALIIWDILKLFKLNIKNLISITSDNGSNVVKCVKILQVLQTGVFDDYLDGENLDVIERLIDAEIEKLPTYPSLNGIRCMAHTLNLCVDDAMKGEF